ncbi:MAG: 2-oxoglutarate dehydrogenase, E2 component, dihydrolipoamide succinyltransferase, partial [Actinobacteria bacterium]|nr:2-oxoglutarate dehydrogenase, E2 component, dihydrolipoamide succinyltransferase [Actinomycetota bacterium]
MSESVVLPALGESVTEGTVTRWLKNIGDTVEVDEPLLEVSTDKVDTEVPSPIAGVLEEILVQEDETAEVGAVLARIGDGSGSAAPAAAPAAAAPEVVAEPAPAPAAAEPAPAAEAAAPVASSG